MLTCIIIVIVCILIEGFFSGSEIAIVSCNKIKIRHDAEKGRFSAKIIQDIITNPEKLFGTTLLGTNLAAVIASVAMTSLMVALFGAKGEIYTILIMAPLLLLVGEIIPKTLYQKNADKIAPIVIIPIKVFSYIFSPVVFITQKIIIFLVGILNDRDNIKNPLIKKDDLMLMVEEETDGTSKVDIKLSKKEMIQRIFKFGDITAKEVMTPFVELMAVEIDSSITELINRAKRDGYSRIPIYDGKFYNIVGVVNTFDLLFVPVDGSIKIADIIRPVLYVPETKKAEDIFKEFQNSLIKIAIVVNEYGGSVGIVSVEDIIEEIVGEIQDEYDSEERMYTKIDDKRYLIDARMEIDAIVQKLDIEIPKGPYETLSGFLLKEFENIPKKGNTLRYKDILFKIEDADPKRIKMVLLTLQDPQAEEGKVVL